MILKPLTLFFIFLYALNATTDYDILIKNGKILDGTGNPWYIADIAIIDDRIVEMGDLQNKTANKVIDATGLYVAPGFIDAHSHAAGGLVNKELSSARSLLAQGITTVIVNPDGGGAVDLKRQQAQLTEHGLGVNAAQMVPHGSIRRQIIGSDDRAPEPAELEEMKRLTEEGMKAGAVGMSTGLFYAPASYAETEEIIELAKIVNRYNGIHQSHIRDESDYSVGVVNAVQEIIDITEASGVVGIVTHIKALGPNVWGKSEKLVNLINDARENRGLEIFADQYPYEASATGLMAALVPRWATAGGRDAFLERLEDQETRAQIAEEMEENLARRGGADRIVMRNVSFNNDLEGVSLEQIADDMALSPIEATISLLMQGSPGIVSFNMHPDDVEYLMKQPWTMTASDGGLVAKGDGVPHPRNYGSFPRKLQEYVLNREVIDISSAIRGMTSLPATVYRLPGRGLLQPGMSADLIIFNKDEIRDLATFTEPHQLSEGMVLVLVNGEPAILNNEFTGSLNGRILLRSEQ